MKNYKKLFDLYIRFVKISAQTFGGGYAMMPMVEKELVEKNNLLSHADVLDDYAMGQTIPGAIGVNASALMGYRVCGRFGLIISILGFITPSIIIITLISALLVNVQNNEYVSNAFMALRAGVVALMLNSLVNIIKRSLKSFMCYLLFFLAIIGILFFNLHPFFLISGGAIISVLYGIIAKRDSV